MSGNTIEAQETIVERKIGAETLYFRTGFLAKQATGSCVVRYGDTCVLIAVTAAEARPGTDFFPLTVDYRERVAAAGKFPGGFLKREGRPTNKEILTSRLIDRPLRPMFPKGYRDEVQVQAITLSSDRQNDPDILAMNGASMALCLTPLPFMGPLGAVRVGLVNEELIVFPTQDELEVSDLDLIVSGDKENVLMIEGFARELPETRILEALKEAHLHIVEICQLQEELIAKINPEKKQLPEQPENPYKQVLLDKYYEPLKTAQQTEGKMARKEALDAVKQQAVTELSTPAASEGEEPTPPESGPFGEAFYALEHKVVRDLILSGVRSDGRAKDNLRDLYCQVGVLPRVHGSSLFQRGETQALVTITLGTARDEQRVDGLAEEYSKKFMLDYNFPPFSVGECRPIRGPGRREIGHGMLAERSVKPVLPDPEEFPYTIRVISDILESNGSSSMATVCGAILGLMDAGVPITNPVAGISIGLVKEEDRHMLLWDIQGEEDHHGDMDFKVAGSPNGITGIQLDLKIHGLSFELIEESLEEARKARWEILKAMIHAISRPRVEVSKFAPRMQRTKIDPDKIGMLIGPGGKTIRTIQEETNTIIEVEDDGTVIVSSDSAEGAIEAMKRIEALTQSVKVGRIYQGRVTSIKDFGAFVEIFPGKDGLCHISELSDGFVRNVGDICRPGDEIPVKVIAIDEHQRVKLSRKAALLEEEGEGDAEPPEDEEAIVEEVETEEYEDGEDFVDEEVEEIGDEADDEEFDADDSDEAASDDPEASERIKE